MSAQSANKVGRYTAPPQNPVQLVIEDLALSQFGTHYAAIQKKLVELPLGIPGVNLEQLLDCKDIYIDKGLRDTKPEHRTRRQYSARLKWNHPLDHKLPVSQLEIFDKIRELCLTSTPPLDIRWASAPINDRATWMIATVSKPLNAAEPALSKEAAQQIVCEYLQSCKIFGTGCFETSSEPDAPGKVVTSCFTRSYKTNCGIVGQEHRYKEYDIDFQHFPGFIPITHPALVAVYVGDHLHVREDEWKRNLEDMMRMSNKDNSRIDAGQSLNVRNLNRLKISYFTPDGQCYVAYLNSMEAATYLTQNPSCIGRPYKLVFFLNDQPMQIHQNQVDRHRNSAAHMHRIRDLENENKHLRHFVMDMSAQLQELRFTVDGDIDSQLDRIERSTREFVNQHLASVSSTFRITNSELQVEMDRYRREVIRLRRDLPIRLVDSDATDTGDSDLLGSEDEPMSDPGNPNEFDQNV